MFDPPTVEFEVEPGETVVITHGGRRVATIGPAGAGNGAALWTAVAVDEISFDPGSAVDVATARDVVDDQGLEWLDG